MLSASFVFTYQMPTIKTNKGKENQVKRVTMSFGNPIKE